MNKFKSLLVFGLMTCLFNISADIPSTNRYNFDDEAVDPSEQSWYSSIKQKASNAASYLNPWSYNNPFAGYFNTPEENEDQNNELEDLDEEVPQAIADTKPARASKDKEMNIVPDVIADTKPVRASKDKETVNNESARNYKSLQSLSSAVTESLQGDGNMHRYLFGAKDAFENGFVDTARMTLNDGLDFIYAAQADGEHKYDRYIAIFTSLLNQLA